MQLFNPSKHLNSPLSEENLSIPKSPVDKAEYKTGTQEMTRETTKQSLESQWRMVQRKKHEEFSYLKALEKKKKNDNTNATTTGLPSGLSQIVP